MGRVKSLYKNGSEVEEIAEKCEMRLLNRIPITMNVRKRFLHYFSQVSKELNCHHSKIPIAELYKFRDAVAKEKDSNRFLIALGFRNKKTSLLSVLDKAIEICLKTDDDRFHYRDFNFYYTVLEPTLPFMRNGIVSSLLLISLFYILTPIIFCSLEIRGVCPVSSKSALHGYVSAIYFASTTMSTVGYGDLGVFSADDPPKNWHILLVTVYMLVAVYVGTTALRAGFEAAFSPFLTLSERIINRTQGELKDDQLLYVKVRRVKQIKLLGIFMQFLLMNLIGLFISRAFVDWSWTTSLYWVVQTSLTVGYGDLTMDEGMRDFQIFYLVISTFVVGDVLGKIADLGDEIQQLRRNWAFERREVSRGMIDDFQGYNNDGLLDQYEFVVASLLFLNKISPKDINPIMKKFKQLAGDDNQISIDDSQEESTDQGQDADFDIDIPHTQNA